MQLYDNLYEVKVSSVPHGDRIFIVTARTMMEALGELKSVIEPWASDKDMELTICRVPDNTFVVVTDWAFTGKDK